MFREPGSEKEPDEKWVKNAEKCHSRLEQGKECLKQKKFIECECCQLQNIRNIILIPHVIYTETPEIIHAILHLHRCIFACLWKMSVFNTFQILIVYRCNDPLWCPGVEALNESMQHVTLTDSQTMGWICVYRWVTKKDIKSVLCDYRYIRQCATTWGEDTL